MATHGVSFNILNVLHQQSFIFSQNVKDRRSSRLVSQQATESEESCEFLSAVIMIPWSTLIVCSYGRLPVPLLIGWLSFAWHYDIFRDYTHLRLLTNICRSIFITSSTSREEKKMMSLTDDETAEQPTHLDNSGGENKKSDLLFSWVSRAWCQIYLSLLFSLSLMHTHMVLVLCACMKYVDTIIHTKTEIHHTAEKHNRGANSVIRWINL